MRPTEERPAYGYWDGDDRPDPVVAQSAPEFVNQLRALVQWSGLSLEEIEQLARANGDILPPSILSIALSHNTLPPEEVVVALVAAIGDSDEMVEQWASVLWHIEEIEAAGATAATTVTPAVGSHGAPRQASRSAPPHAPHSPPAYAPHSPPAYAPHSAPAYAPHSAPAYIPDGRPGYGPDGDRGYHLYDEQGYEPHGYDSYDGSYEDRGYEPRDAPLSSTSGSSGGSRQYSGGSLAEAVKKRRNQDGWTGLHRGFQKGLRATGLGAKLGRWPTPVAVAAAIFVVIVGVVWAVAGGGDGEHVAEPPASACCTPGTTTPSADPSDQALPSEDPAVLPLPDNSTNTSHAPRVTTPPPRNSPTPTQTQTTQAPRLTSNGNASCVNNGGNWVLTVSVTATLTGATAGIDPVGRAGKSDALEEFPVSGAGGTSFSGQRTITIAPGTDPPPSGTAQWSISVTVEGVASPVSDGGSKGYACS